jgi:hypothetical protein
VQYSASIQSCWWCLRYILMLIIMWLIGFCRSSFEWGGNSWKPSSRILKEGPNIRGYLTKLFRKKVSNNTHLIVCSVDWPPWFVYHLSKNQHSIASPIQRHSQNKIVYFINITKRKLCCSIPQKVLLQLFNLTNWEVRMLFINPHKISNKCPSCLIWHIPCLTYCRALKMSLLNCFHEM